MSCPSCGRPRFLEETGKCAICVSTDVQRAHFMAGRGGVGFVTVGDQTLLAYHDCYGRITYAVTVS